MQNYRQYAILGALIQLIQGYFDMKKADIVAKVSEESGLSKKDSEAALDSLLGVITDSLKSGEEVPFIGFGTFKVSHRPEREGRNPSTGKPMKIAASNVVNFKAGSKLKEAVNSK